MALKLSAVTRVDCFGVSLEELVARQNGLPWPPTSQPLPQTPHGGSSGGAPPVDSSPLELPKFLNELLTYLKKKGAVCKGIFVNSGDDVTIQLLKKLYNKDGTVPLDKYKQSLLSIAGLLRLFFAELPEPLLTKKFGPTFIKTNTNPDASIKFKLMKKVYTAVPAAHKVVLAAVLDLFRHLLHYRAKNQLTTAELCNEFGYLLAGVDKLEAVPAGDMLKTLVIQLPFLNGTSVDPVTAPDVPLARSSPKKSQAKPSDPSPATKEGSRVPKPSTSRTKDATKTSKGTRHKKVTSKGSTRHKRHSRHEGDYSDSHSIEFSDVFKSVLDSSIQNILFEPTVRISYTYETKIPHFIRKLYTGERLMATASREAQDKEEARGFDSGLHSGMPPTHLASMSSIPNPRLPAATTRRNTVTEKPKKGDLPEVLPQTTNLHKKGSTDLASPRRSMELDSIAHSKSKSTDHMGAKLGYRKSMQLPASSSGLEYGEELDKSADSDSEDSKKSKRGSGGGSASKAKAETKAKRGESVSHSRAPSSASGGKTPRSERAPRSDKNERVNDKGEKVDPMGRSIAVSDSPSADGKRKSDDRKKVERDSSAKSLGAGAVHKRTKTPAEVAKATGDANAGTVHKRADSKTEIPVTHLSKRKSVTLDPAKLDSDGSESTSTASAGSAVPVHSASKNELASLDPQKEKEIRQRLKANPEYEKLTAEKKELQLKLNQFQEEFMRKAGRKIMYESDKAEVQGEYDRYKQIKTRLGELEKAEMLKK